VSEMLERMCRAMCVAELQDPDEMKHMGGAPVPLWTLFEPGMRAALREVRTPTEAMKLAYFMKMEALGFHGGMNASCAMETMVDEALK
jgi:hypothetical protein